MARCIEGFRALFQDESGQDLIEYALIAALIGLTSVAAMGSLATSITNTFTGMGSQLDNAIPSS